MKALGSATAFPVKKGISEEQIPEVTIFNTTSLAPTDVIGSFLKTNRPGDSSRAIMLLI